MLYVSLVIRNTELRHAVLFSNCFQIVKYVTSFNFNVLVIDSENKLKTRWLSVTTAGGTFNNTQRTLSKT